MSRPPPLKSTAAPVNTQTDNNKRHDWTSSNPNWTDDQKVAVAIRRYVAYEPTGQVAIDGTFEENEVLTANTLGIMDQNDLTNVSYSYQWARQNCTDSANDGDITGATSSTHTLTDITCLVSVKVSFSDDVGFEHELTGSTIDLSLTEWALSVSPSQITEGSSNGATVTLRITNGQTYNSPVTANLYYDTTLVESVENLDGEDNVHTITITAGFSQGSAIILTKDDEVYGGNNTYDLTARLGQTQLGRRDPDHRGRGRALPRGLAQRGRQQHRGGRVVHHHRHHLPDIHHAGNRQHSHYRPERRGARLHRH